MRFVKLLVGMKEITEGTYREGAGDRVEAYVYLVNKVCRIADTHEGAARIDVILPTIQLLVVLEGEVEPFALRLKEQAVRFQVRPLYVGDVLEVDSSSHGGALEGMKTRLSLEEANRDAGEKP